MLALGGIRRAGALGAATVLLATLTGVTSSQARGAAPPAGNIRAVLQPPYTFYTADLTDPDGNTLTYDWSATTIACGSWQAAVSGGPETADWYHGGGVGELANKSNPPVECDHSGGTNSTNHVGTFWAKVSDGTGDSVTCKFVGPGGPPGTTQQGPPCESTQYDLRVTAEGPAAVDIGLRAEFTFTVTNKGPHPALASLVIPHVGVQERGDEEISVFNPAGAAAAAFLLGTIQPGASVSRKIGLQFSKVGANALAGNTDTDLPPGPPNDPSDNTDTVNVSVAKAACTQKARFPLRAPGGDDGADVKNKPARQVVCTKGGDDKITVGDQDVVYSKGGEDKVTCKEPFCVIELGGGNDVAKCSGLCFVNGGPGKDNCPEGDLVIKEGCEK